MPKVKAAKKAKRGRTPAGRSVFEPLGQALGRYGAASVAGAGVIMLLVTGVLFAGGYFGSLAERTDRWVRAKSVASGFEIRKVRVVGRRAASRADLAGAVGPAVGQSILHYDLDAARARVEALGWVRAAAARRLLPDTLEISIRERRPAAVWQMSGALRLIDANGAVIETVGAGDYPDLPFVVGAGAPEAASELLTALRAYPEIAEQVSAIIRVGDRRWNLRLRNGLDVRLPDSGLDETLETLEGMRVSKGTLDLPLEYLDFRTKTDVYARPTGSAAPVGN